MENDNITWERIYAEIDTILNGGEPEYPEKSKQEESKRKARVIRLKWDPDESADESEINLRPGEIPGQSILKASGKNRRHMFRWNVHVKVKKMRRNNLDISAEILQVAQEGAKKTHIVYKANLNFLIVKKYLNNLIEEGLLSKNDTRYYTTDKGRDFIKSYQNFSSRMGNIAWEDENTPG